VTDPRTSQAISDAIGDTGWRYILGTLRTTVPVGSIGQAGEVAARCTTAGADGHLLLDLRGDRVLPAVLAYADGDPEDPGAAIVDPPRLRLPPLAWIRLSDTLDTQVDTGC
jgi:hypothetical protein